MPQTGAAGFRRSNRDGDSLPAPIVGFDPVDEITAYDNRVSARRASAPTGWGTEPTGRATAPTGWGTEPAGGATAPTRRREVGGGRRIGDESRAATRAAMAEAFATQFGVDEASPSAAALADRFGFRFEESTSGPAGRRTVTITGRGAERSVPPAERSVRRGGGELRRGGGELRRRGGRPDTPIGLHADRAAMWAVGLAIVLALVAAISAHAVPLH